MFNLSIQKVYIMSGKANSKWQQLKPGRHRPQKDEDQPMTAVNTQMNTMKHKLTQRKEYNETKWACVKDIGAPWTQKPGDCAKAKHASQVSLSWLFWAQNDETYNMNNI